MKGQEHILLLSHWWAKLDGGTQLWWSIALVVTFLAVLYAILSLFGRSAEDHPGDHQVSLGVLASVLFGWVGVLLSYLGASLGLAFAVAGGTGFLFFVLIRKISRKCARHTADVGRVSEWIPPHEHGMGKVMLNRHRKGVEWKAITSGRGLRPGEPVRVVEVMEEQVLRVEGLPDQPRKPS